MLKLVAEGANFREACRKLQISRDAVTSKRLVDGDFHDRCARAARLGTEANLEMAEARLKRSTNKRISVDRELCHHYRWKASKLLSAYKDRLGVDVRSDDAPTRHVEDTDLVRRIFFVDHQNDRKATIEDFAKNQHMRLSLVAQSIRTRRDGNGGTSGLHQSLADLIDQFAEEVRKKLSGDMPLLPAPPDGIGEPSRARGGTTPPPAGPEREVNPPAAEPVEYARVGDRLVPVPPEQMAEFERHGGSAEEQGRSEHPWRRHPAVVRRRPS